MDNLIVLKACDEGSCCSLSQRSSVAGIAIVGLILNTVDLVVIGPCMNLSCKMREHVETFRVILTTQFQVASLLLLLASVIEIAFLVQLYLWCTLGFVVMGLVVSLVDFLTRMRKEGPAWACAVFVPEVAFLFVLCLCLPLIDTYRKHLQGLPLPSRSPSLVNSL